MHHHHSHRYQAAPTVCCLPVSQPMSCNCQASFCMPASSCNRCQALATSPCSCNTAAPLASCCLHRQSLARCSCPSASALTNVCACECPPSCTKKAAAGVSSEEKKEICEKVLAVLAKAVHPQCACAKQATSGAVTGEGGELASTKCGCPLVVTCGCGPDCKKCDCEHDNAKEMSTCCGGKTACGDKQDRGDQSAQ